MGPRGENVIGDEGRDTRSLLLLVGLIIILLNNQYKAQGRD